MPFIWWKTRKNVESTLNDKMNQEMFHLKGQTIWYPRGGGILLKKNCLFPYWSEKFFLILIKFLKSLFLIQRIFGYTFPWEL